MTSGRNPTERDGYKDRMSSAEATEERETTRETPGRIARVKVTPSLRTLGPRP